MNQQGLLADKKREGRCSDDYFFFTVCGKHFSGFIEALDSEGILCTLALKKVLRQPITTRVFVVGHPAKYYPRRTGLNFVERADHVAVLVV